MASVTICSDFRAQESKICNHFYFFLIYLPRSDGTSKFGKLSNGHKPGKGQFLFQSQRKVMSKNVQAAIQQHSFHMLARLCLKSFKLGFSGMCTKNFQMFKLDLEKAGEREIKSSISTGSWRKQGNSRKTSTSASLTMLKSLTVWITTNWKVLKEMGIPDQLTCLLRNLYAGQETSEPDM